MPIFEYVCKQCEKSFEALVMGSRQPECPSCHGQKLEQRFSVFAPAVAQSKSSAPAPGGCCGGGACGVPAAPGGCCMDN